MGHGSRDPDALVEMQALSELVARRVDGPVSYGWIELAEPLATDAGIALARAVDTLVVQPVLLFAAHHSRVDVPMVADVIAGEVPVRLHVGSPLGLHPLLVDLAAERIRQADPDPRDDSALLVVGSGSSDPDAQALTATASRVLAERTGYARVGHAFASVASPGAGEAVARLVAGGAAAVTVFSWSLLAGRLANAAEQEARAAASAAGAACTWAGRLGPAPVVADALADRYREALLVV